MNRFARTGGVVTLVASALLQPSIGAASEYSEVWQRGHAIAKKKCAVCHAISSKDASPHKDAPPFRDIAKRYAVEGLAEALAEGITVGHPDMPEFVFPPEEISELLTFMDSFSQSDP